MEKPPKYNIQPASEKLEGKKGFLIYNDNQLPMSNHQGFHYMALPKGVASVIVKDINEILLLDTYLEEGDRKKAYSYSEVSKHPKFLEIRKKQEMQSFTIGVHNTLMAVVDDPTFGLELEKVIQWDFLYRMSPGPKEKMEQMEAAHEAIHWLGKDWVDLPGNYARTFEDMEADEIPFVPQSILDRLNAEVATMTKPEQVAVWYLYEFFNRFSITIPILWVKGALSSTCLEESYYVFSSDVSLKSLRLKRKKGENFIQRRLAYLRQYLQAFRLDTLELIDRKANFWGD